MTEASSSQPAPPAPDIHEALGAEAPALPRVPPSELPDRVRQILAIDDARATFLVAEAGRLYTDRMRQRFSELRVAERLKRTNPFLLRIRGAKTVRDWARFQVEGALYASEEEAVGHLLEAVAKECCPHARMPT